MSDSCALSLAAIRRERPNDQSFFSEHLCSHKSSSIQTIESYRIRHGKAMHLLQSSSRMSSRCCRFRLIAAGEQFQ
jgi:hypothetical protein